jgi:hypothetical protein
MTCIACIKLIPIIIIGLVLLQGKKINSTLFFEDIFENVFLTYLVLRPHLISDGKMELRLRLMYGAVATRRVEITCVLFTQLQVRVFLKIHLTYICLLFVST